MTGLDPVIHAVCPPYDEPDILGSITEWIAGTSPAMTEGVWLQHHSLE